MMDNKDVFSSNLKKYMEVKGKSRKEICEDLNVSYYTFSDWVNGKKYPRMDKIEMLAKYFGISKTDLIEEETYDDKNSIVGKIMKRFRESQNMTVEEFSNDIGITRSDLSKYESGEKRIPNEVLEIFADYYDTNVENIKSFNMASNKNTTTILSTSDTYISRLKEWELEMEGIVFTKEELEQLIDYSKYIVYKRDN